MLLRLFWSLLLGLASTGAYSAESTAFRPISCAGDYQFHLQGVAAGDDALYWCFTSELVKTGPDGKLEKKISVPGHHGDLCYRDGRIYVAVNLGKFNRAAGEADSWVYVYRADDLSLVTRHALPETVHGAGGIAYGDGRYLVVGGLPNDQEENLVFEYDEEFKFVAKHALKSGHTLLGIQTAAFADGRWWFGCYGDALLTADRKLSTVQRFEFDAAIGLVPLADGRFLVARGGGKGEKPARRYTGRLVAAKVDAAQGLVTE
jgi:hypothetical protein